MDIKIGTYGDYKSKNYGINCIFVKIGVLTLYFSYQTVIAYEFKGNLVISENMWNRTTGKHLNFIDNKSKRINRKDFESKLDLLLKELNLKNKIKVII